MTVFVGIYADEGMPVFIINFLADMTPSGDSPESRLELVRKYS